jgi:hypothetical protein
VKQSAWLGIGVGTLIAALGLWFGLFAIQSNGTTGLAIITVGIIFAMYAMTIFNGVEDAATVAFHSALYAIVTATMLVILFTTTGSPSYLVAAPVLSLGVGGVVGVPPVGNRLRTLTRAIAVALVTFIAVTVYWVDHTVYALMAPLISLPAVGLADRIFEKGREVAAE